MIAIGNMADGKFNFKESVYRIQPTDPFTRLAVGAKPIEVQPENLPNWAREIVGTSVPAVAPSYQSSPQKKPAPAIDSSTVAVSIAEPALKKAAQLLGEEKEVAIQGIRLLEQQLIKGPYSVGFIHRDLDMSRTKGFLPERADKANGVVGVWQIDGSVLRKGINTEAKWYEMLFCLQLEMDSNRALRIRKLYAGDSRNDLNKCWEYGILPIGVRSFRDHFGAKGSSLASCPHPHAHHLQFSEDVAGWDSRPLLMLCTPHCPWQHGRKNRRTPASQPATRSGQWQARGKPNSNR